MTAFVWCSAGSVRCRAFPPSGTKQFACDRRKEYPLSMSKTLDIASVGNMCVDIMLPMMEYPILAGRHQKLKTEARLELGGSLNALISASNLGARTGPIAYLPLGDSSSDPSQALFSNHFIGCAKRLELDTSAVIRRAGVRLPTCAALFDPQGTHTFLASNEIPDEIVVQDDSPLPNEISTTISRSKVLIVDGYALHSDRKLVKDSVHVALEAGTHVWVDPQDAVGSLIRQQDPLFGLILNRATGISLNIDQAKLMTEMTKPLDIIRRLVEKQCPSARTFLLKDGSNGGHVAEKTASADFEIHAVSAFSLEKGLFKDSIGAGDSFLGAFLAASLSHGFSLQDSGVVASAMGAATCMNHGAGESGIGSLDGVLQLLDKAPNVAQRLQHLRKA